MSQTKLIAAYDELKKSYGHEFSPGKFKGSIYLINFQFLNLFAESKSDVSIEITDALFDLHKIYQFFDKID